MTAAARLIVATLIGAGGLWLTVSGLAQRRPSLVKMSAHLGRTHVVLSVPADGTRSIEVGAKVSFEIGPGRNGQWEARAVSRR